MRGSKYGIDRASDHEVIYDLVLQMKLLFCGGSWKISRPMWQWEVWSHIALRGERLHSVWQYSWNPRSFGSVLNLFWFPLLDRDSRQRRNTLDVVKHILGTASTSWWSLNSIKNVATAIQSTFLPYCTYIFVIWGHRAWHVWVNNYNTKIFILIHSNYPHKKKGGA